MDILKAEIERKRKQVQNAELVAPNKKFFKRGDLAAKQQDEYWKKYYEKHGEKRPQPETKEASSDEALRVIESSQDSTGHGLTQLTREEVIKRLRGRAEPITLFGETEQDSQHRLRKLEIEQPDMKEGWKNDFQAALQKVDDELLKEVIEGTQHTEGKHDVLVEDDIKNFDEIRELAKTLGKTEQPSHDCDIIYAFLNYLIQRWGRDLNARDEETKRTATGKFDSGMHKQTIEQLKPLTTSLKSHSINSDIRHHLVNICRIMLLDKDYIQANNAYMQMAIGNAPWPVGVTRSGIHQRPGSSKSYVANIAHVLNDETQRKYIQAFKRLMTKCQEFFPADPSRSVEYVRPVKQTSEEDA